MFYESLEASCLGRLSGDLPEGDLPVGDLPGGDFAWEQNLEMLYLKWMGAQSRICVTVPLESF